ncbi:hypothetical protein FQN55_007969 [Onygenales sp. PD_40]|nr:hypothetical protein FQN55_007969 [Onygenales sp. PD_40]KAK2803399.1 hypothetical protein FQN51_003506 [Onygenales sp. PD_10]
MVSFNLLVAAGLLATAVSGAPAASYDATASYDASTAASSGKRGLAYNNAALLAPFASKRSSFSWAYNWAGSVGGDLFGTEFVPMLWGRNGFNAWKTAADASLAAGTHHLLAFNEPDLPAQANMSPVEAAAAYQRYMNPYAGRARLGSPAVTNGASPYGLTWMGQFFAACSGNCHVDFLVVHWYDGAEHASYFKKHIEAAVAFARQHGISKIWITEFQGTGSDAAQVAFLKDVLPWLDANDGVERYAYFMADRLVNGLSLSPVGQAYSS